MKSFITSFLLGLFLFTGVYILYVATNEKVEYSPVVKGVRKAYNATCRISAEHAMVGYIQGTGVLLNTGYVLTASHIIDNNFNKKVDPHERKVKLEFFDDDGTAKITTGTVVLCGDYEKTDLAFLEVENPPKSDIKLGFISVGEEMYTIGATKGSRPNISMGMESTIADGLGRASVAIWKGNSGGGIWNNKQELCGIATRVYSATTHAPYRITMRIPMEGGPIWVNSFGSIRVSHPLANWCGYEQTSSIRKLAKDHNMGFLCDIQKEEKEVNPYYIRMGACLIGVICCVWIFRKLLFSSRMS